MFHKLQGKKNITFLPFALRSGGSHINRKEFYILIQVVLVELKKE